MYYLGLKLKYAHGKSSAHFCLTSVALWDNQVIED